MAVTRTTERGLADAAAPVFDVDIQASDIIVRSHRKICYENGKARAIAWMSRGQMQTVLVCEIDDDDDADADSDADADADAECGALNIRQRLDWRFEV